MKYILLKMLITVSTFSAKAQRDSLPQNDSIILQIKALDFSQFIGKPVDSLLAHLPSGYNLEMRTSIVLKRAGYLAVVYAPSTAVYIGVDTFQYMNPRLSVTALDPKANWDIELFKKETIWFASAVNGSCFNGCADLSKVN